MHGTLRLYLTENRSGTVRLLNVDYDGGLTEIQSVHVGGTVMPMAISPDRRRLFAAIRSEPHEIACFAIDAADGTIAEIARTPALESTVYLDTDRSGRYLLGACNPTEGRKTGIVAVYPIGDDGVAQAPLAIRTPPKLHAIKADPANRFLIAPSCNGDVMMRYRFDHQTGEASPDGLEPVIVRPGCGPRHLQFHPAGRFVVLVNEYDGSVVVYGWSAESGRLRELHTIMAAPAEIDSPNKRAADLHFTPDGRWLYVSFRSRPYLTVFAVDQQTGQLDLVDSYVTADEPRSFCIDPSGRFLFAVGLKEDRIASFRIDADSGRLSRMKDYKTGGGPNWIECVRSP